MKELRDYQVSISDDALDILKEKKIVVLNMEVRCGKTLTALETCKNYGASKVLFITKIKAFSSIQLDYNDFGYTFDLTIINKESIHKIESNDFDVIVCDESHGLFGTFPKPNNFTKIYKKKFSEIPMILMSGTLTPESFSQIYHQFYVSDYSPFKLYTNFYKWAKDFVNVKQRQLGYAIVNDYSDANKKLIDNYTKDYIISFTQKEAGFSSNVIEEVLTVEMLPVTYNLIKRLKKDLIIVSPTTGMEIIGDTAVKLMQKVHQLSSGTIKFEDGSSKIIDRTKAVFIEDRFKNNKIGIFYKFKEELNLLKEVFGNKLTTDLEEFNNSDKSIALQFISGREGISLKNADYLVAFNIDFSATTYFQFKDRLTTKERTENKLYWIFSDGGIEHKVYESVKNKKNFTTANFKKDYDVKIPKKVN